MFNLAYVIRAFDLRRVGSCAKCIKISFILMLSLWVLVVSQFSFGSGMKVTVAGAVIFSALWLSHVFGRAIRMTNNDVHGIESRRRALRKFASAAAGAIVTSLAIAIPSAYADSGCGGWAGNSGCPSGCSSCQRQRSDCSCTGSDRSCGDGC